MTRHWKTHFEHRAPFCFGFISVALLLLGAAMPSGASGPPRGPAPAATKKPVIDVYHGVRVEDDYQWLENWNDPAVRAWSEAENRRARAFLAALPGRDATIRRLKQLAGKSSARYADLAYRHGVLFALKLQPPKQQPFLITLASPENPGSERAVADPNRIDPSGSTAIDFYAPSLDGRLVALSMSRGGSENGLLHVYDVASGKPLADVIPRVNKGTAGGSVAWNADATGFYYTRYPSSGERPAAELDFYQEIYFHKLGTPASADTYSLGKDFPRIAEIALQSSTDGRYVLAAVANGDGGQFEHYLLGPDGKWRELTRFSDGITAAVFGDDGALYLLSKQNAPRGKILRLPLANPILSAATTIVRESDDVIESITPAAHRLYVTDVWGGPSDLRIFGLRGESLGKVPIGAVSAVNQVVRLGGDDVLYETQSYLEPPAWFRFAASSGRAARTALFETAPVGYSDAKVIRAFATSKDGAKVPMNIIWRKGTKLGGENPVLLTGYGGFDISLTPQYSYLRRLWLDRGGVWVIANLRGGGEYGESWHEQGMLTRKQNVFDDFAACAEYLIHSGYTNPSKLAIEGGSNGGLLMGAALTQHPKLFRAVVSFVGIYDMLREEATTPNAVFNTTEYGSVKNAAQFRALYAYSPYYHVVNGARYPAVLFFTGANDPRVNPMQSRKMTARLQAATSSGLPILLRTSSNSGHIDSSVSEQIEEEADTFAFIWHELGVRPGLPNGH
ncbi:MAG: prolyl oligopeptidase family serine peptidase [Terriglobia bacterium]